MSTTVDKTKSERQIRAEIAEIKRQSSKPAKQRKVEPSKVDLTAEFDLASELKTLEQTVNRLENAVSREEYRKAFVQRDCCNLLDYLDLG